MKTQKPNWTSKEINSKMRRWEDLTHQTADHFRNCQCNLCMEAFGLGELLGTFTEDEKAGAVIEERREPVLENEFIRPEKSILSTDFDLMTL